MKKIVIGGGLTILGLLLSNEWILLLGVYLLMLIVYGWIFEFLVVDKFQLGKLREARERAETYTISCSLITIGLAYLLMK